MYWHGLMPVKSVVCGLACIVSAHFNTKLMFMYAEAKPGKVETDCQC